MAAHFLFAAIRHEIVEVARREEEGEMMSGYIPRSLGAF